MAGCRHWTLVGLSFLLLAMTELTAPASSYHLRGEESYPESPSPYSAALEKDIGGALHLLSYLLEEKDDIPQEDGNLASTHGGERKDLSKIVRQPGVLDSVSSLSREPGRRNLLLALIERMQLKALLKSAGNFGGDADDANDAVSNGSDMVGFESFLNREPTSSAAASAKIDDAIPAAVKTKRGRHGHYGAMPPTNELCRMMRVRCY